jgi:DNA polymerase-3 subunit gamma/tau
MAHLRHLFVVQTLGHVPDSFAVTAEHTDRLSGQAARMAQGEVLRAIDLLGAAVAAVRDGSEPRIQLELALLKGAEPEADRSLSALMFRIERLEQRLAVAGPPAVAGDETGAPEGGAETPPSPAGSHADAAAASAPLPSPAPMSAPPSPAVAAAARVEVAAPRRAAAPAPAASPAQAPSPAAAAEAVPASAAEVVAQEAPDLDRVRALWPAALGEVARQNAMVAALLGEARPTALEGERLTVTFPPDHAFSRKKAESNRELLQAALHGLLGRGLLVACELGDGPVEEGLSGLSEEELLARLREEFDARELLDDEQPSPRS